MKRKFSDRILDRLWREAGKRLARDLACETGPSAGGSSISCNLPWAEACGMMAEGRLGSHDFRRLRAVKSVVETVGLSDARFYAGRIRQWGADWLAHPAVAAIDDWGNPMRGPRLLLGTMRPFSPTTLRYLATALWLRRSGKLEDRGHIVEIGVGFGGLAAMNALVSGARTMMVDLPQVERTAMRMLAETRLEGYGVTSDAAIPASIPLVVSNYAFTELNAALQDLYLEKYLKRARHGVIVSNARVFARTIGGRTDDELVELLRQAGLPATIECDHELLSSIDALCGVRLIHW